MFKFLTGLWSKETPNVTAAAILIGGASLASRAIGLVRDRLLAGHFGAGPELDAYYAAFRLPDFFYQLIILGALSAGFIPIFTEYLEKRGQSEAWKLAERVFTTIALVFGVVCLGLFILAHKLVPYMVPGFSGDQLHTTIALSRILLISTFIMGLSAVMGGILQATRRFLAFSLAPVLYNAGIIIGVLGFAPSFGVSGVAYGVVLGAGLHFLVQALVAMPLGLKRFGRPSFKDPGVRQILRLMLPRIGGLAASQVNMTILLVLASTLSAGSIAVFNFANNLQYVPIGLIGISFAVAAFPSFSKLAAAGDIKGLKDSFLTTTHKILFLIVPATALMLLLRAQIVRLVLGAGVFDWDATIRTADVLAIFVFALMAHAMIPLLARAFYALKDTRTPLLVSLFSMLDVVFLALLLKGPYGLLGLAAAFALDGFAQFILLWFLLRRRFGHLEGKYLSKSLGKIILASIALFGFGWLARQAVGTVFPLRTFWQVALQAGAACVLGGGAFYVVARLLRVAELDDWVRTLKHKLYRQAKITEGVEKAGL